MIADLASVFNESHFITVLEENEFRHFLLTGRARMIFPEPGLPILPGQYALVTPGADVIVRPIPEALMRAARPPRPLALHPVRPRPADTAAE